MNTTIICFTGDLKYNEVTREAWSLNSTSDTATTAFVTSVILLLFMVVGLPWNFGVLVKQIKDKFYKEPSSFLLFIFNLALVDFHIITCCS